MLGSKDSLIPFMDTILCNYYRQSNIGNFYNNIIKYYYKKSGMKKYFIYAHSLQWPEYFFLISKIIFFNLKKYIVKNVEFATIKEFFITKSERINIHVVVSILLMTNAKYIFFELIFLYKHNINIFEYNTNVTCVMYHEV